MSTMYRRVCVMLIQVVVIAAAAALFTNGSTNAKVSRYI